MSKINFWCPRKEQEPDSACTPYMAPEHLCQVCHSVYQAAKAAVKQADQKAGEQERRIVRLRDLLFKRRAHEPQHSRTDHECAECTELYDLRQTGEPLQVICDCGVPSCNKVSDHRKEQIGGKRTPCDKQYSMEDSYSYCGRDLWHGGPCGRG